MSDSTMKLKHRMHTPEAQKIQRSDAKCRTKIRIQQIHTKIQTLPHKRTKKCNNITITHGNSTKHDKNT